MLSGTFEYCAIIVVKIENLRSEVAMGMDMFLLVNSVNRRFDTFRNDKNIISLVGFCICLAMGIKQSVVNMARHNIINATVVKAKIDTTNLLKKITAKEVTMYNPMEATCIRFTRTGKIYTQLCKSKFIFYFPSYF